MMRRAGRAVFEQMLAGWPGITRLSICCGKGNNAGDGYVVARLALEQGFEVELIQIGDQGALTGDAATARDEALALGLNITRTEDGGYQPRGELLVDALLGTGLSGAARGAYARLIEQMNRSGRPVVAVDVPSGVLADTGSAPGPAVRATLTVTFIGRKIGLHTGAGAALAGRIHYADLGVGDEVRRQVVGIPWLRFDELVADRGLPRRDPNSYKQALGHLVVAGGDESMGGAPLMAAEAALRAGAGMVTVLTRGIHRNAMLARRPELMVVDAADETLRDEVLTRADVLLVGPGLGRGSWGEALLAGALAAGKPMVIDADGLFLLAERGELSAGAESESRAWVLTPHTGEAATLLGCSIQDVQADRIEAARRLVKKTGAVSVLKGAGSVIAWSAGEQPCRAGICAHGNPGMATAGMGDVLAGIVGGLLAQLKATPPRQAVEDAGLLGTCLHSLAADRAARRLGEATLLATDILSDMGELLRSTAAGSSAGVR